MALMPAHTSELDNLDLRARLLEIQKAEGRAPPCARLKHDYDDSYICRHCGRSMTDLVAIGAE